MLLYEGSATACTDQQVTPGETYVYRAFAKNSWGDYQTNRCQVSCQVPVAKTLGQAEAGQTVRLAEDGTDQDYLVLAHGYPAAGRTLLLRRHAVSNTMFDSKVANEYSGSLLDQQCTALLGRLDQAIQPLVEAVEIAYTTGGSHTLSQIQRQVFCLSLTEQGWTPALRPTGRGRPYRSWCSTRKLVLGKSRWRTVWVGRSSKTPSGLYSRRSRPWVSTVMR